MQSRSAHRCVALQGMQGRIDACVMTCTILTVYSNDECAGHARSKAALHVQSPESWSKDTHCIICALNVATLPQEQVAAGVHLQALNLQSITGVLDVGSLIACSN